MKTTQEIFQEMLNRFAQQTGMELSQGCDLAVRLYAAAEQIYSLYLQSQWVERQCFPQTAQGEYLSLHAQLRGVERKPAVQAQGTLRFYVEQAQDTPRVISAGTVCLTQGLVRFETTQQATLEPDSLYVDVPAQAMEAGSAGNVAAGTICVMSAAPVGISGCTNPQAFSGGTDQEEDEPLRERVLSTYRRLPNGANAAFYEQIALSVEEVAAASVIPRSRGRGTVDVVIATQAGEPGEELLEQVQQLVDERREIAVDAQVRAPETVTVDVAAAIKAAPGYDGVSVRGEVERVLRAAFTGKLLGQGVLRAWLGSLIYGVEGVENYSLTAPEADLTGQADQLPTLGSLQLEAMA